MLSHAFESECSRCTPPTLQFCNISVCCIWWVPQIKFVLSNNFLHNAYVHSFREQAVGVLLGIRDNIKQKWDVKKSMLTCLFWENFEFFFSLLTPGGGGPDDRGGGGSDSNKKDGANYRAVYITIPIVLLTAVITLLLVICYRRSVHISGGKG